MGNVPEHGPVLLVGNHTGGNMAPEVVVLPLAFSTYFGVERPFYQLAHNLVLASPAGPFLRRYGTMAASHKHATKALQAGRRGARLPGRRLGGPPALLAGRQDRLRRPQGLRPAGARRGRADRPGGHLGGQETALFLSRGTWLAKLTRVDKLFRLKVLPISIALPWGLNVGDMLGHIPLPAKITIEVLEPIDLREQFGDEPDPEEVGRVRPPGDAGDARRARRRAALPGDRLSRCGSASRSLSADRAARLGLPHRPRQLPPFHVRRHPLGGRRRAAERARRPLPDADAGRLGRDRRPGRGRRVLPSAATWRGPR